MYPGYDLSKTFSQADVKQDQWVRVLASRYSIPRTFLDIGSGDEVHLSNTYALELEGWTGLRTDRAAPAEQHRKTPFIISDAATVDWPRLLLLHNLYVGVGYLSLDCDENTLAVATKLFADVHPVRFTLCTCEHDAYRFGDGPRAAMREMLTRLGYVLAVPNVTSQGCVFEDWWTDPRIAVEDAQQVADALGVWYEGQDLKGNNP